MKRPSFTKMRTAYKAGHLLDAEMPGGRILRDYTAADCFAAGGWLTDVGRRIRRGWGDGDDYYSGKTVGAVYEEVPLQWSFMVFYMRELTWAPLRDPPQEGDEYDGYR